MKTNSVMLLEEKFPESTCGARVIQVIEEQVRIGSSNKGDIERIATVYRTLEGRILAAYDPLGEGVTFDALLERCK